MAVLHTKSDYYTGGVPFASYSGISQDFNFMFSNNASALAANETAFYQKFGQSSYEGFISWLQGTLKNDAEILRRYTNAQLRTWCAQKLKQSTDELFRKALDDNLMVGQSQLTVSFTAQNQKQIDVSFNKTSGDVTFQCNGKLDIKMGIDENWAKHLINIIGNRRLKVSSDNYSRAKEILSEFNSKAGGLSNLVSFNSNQESVVLSTLLNTYVESKTSKYATGYNKSIGQLRAAGYGSTEVMEFINRVKNDYMSFFYGGSTTLRSAAISVWNNQIESQFNTSLMNSLRMFTFGKALRTASAGTFGEIQTAIIFEYANLMQGGAGNISLLKDIVTEGELGRVDVALFESFGVQVKNYNFYNSTTESLNFNSTATSITQYFDNGGDFLDYLINSHFNTDIGGENNVPLGEALKNSPEFFEGFIYPLLSTYNEEIGGGDTVTFYNLGGTTFIPASMLVEAIGNAITDVSSTLKVEVEESYNGPSGDDDTFMVKPGGDSPLFTDYWVGNQFTNWDSTNLNTTAYCTIGDNIHYKIKVDINIIRNIIENVPTII